MIKALSSRLTAHFRADGSHLDLYMARRPTIAKSLFEDLILHDEVLIPTTDYLTAIGLIQIVGESAFISLLERERIKFVRTRSSFGFVRGTGLEGTLLVFSDPAGRRPQDAPIDDAVAAALAVYPRLKESKTILDLLIKCSFTEETANIIEQVKQEAVKDFKKSEFWKPQYEISTPGLLAIPGVSKMQVRLVNAEPDSKKRAVDAFLSLALYNTDLLLADRYGCKSVSSSAPIGDLIDLKLARSADRSTGLWKLFEVTGIPDLSLAEFSQPGAFDAIEKVLTGSRARDFRVWFHSLKSLSPTEITKEYISVLGEIPLVSRLPSKLLRFVATTGLGLVPVVGPILGTAAGVFDSFVVDQLFRQKSPKFLVDDLNQVTGTLRAKKSDNS